jgi:hypothetical protein
MYDRSRAATEGGKSLYLTPPAAASPFQRWSSSRLPSEPSCSRRGPQMRTSLRTPSPLGSEVCGAELLHKHLAVVAARHVAEAPGREIEACTEVPIQGDLCPHRPASRANGSTDVATTGFFITCCGRGYFTVGKVPIGTFLLYIDVRDHAGVVRCPGRSGFVQYRDVRERMLQCRGDKDVVQPKSSKGLPATLDLSEAVEITRSLPHGHVAAVPGTTRRLGVEELIDPTPSRWRDLVTAMRVAQVIAPGSKLATARGLRTETATSSLGRLLSVAGCDEDDLYAAMDWVLERKEAIENTLAARHLSNGTPVLYDVSSAAFEGHTCPLGKIGHPRDGVKGRLQIVYGLRCSPAGGPIAIEVFEGNTADPKTLSAQIKKLKTRFGLSRVCLVGDRGMLTSARISAELRPGGLDWISALRAPQSRRWSRPARCSCRCSMSRTSSRSTPRSSPASGWCAATTRS